MIATVIAYEALTDIADEAGIDYEDIRTDYSGRGMYGRTCVGFDLDTTGQLFDLGRAVAAAGRTADFGTPSIDSMGRGIVCYWRGLVCDDAPAPTDPWDDYEDGGTDRTTAR